MHYVCRTVYQLYYMLRVCSNVCHSKRLVNELWKYLPKLPPRSFLFSNFVFCTEIWWANIVLRLKLFGLKLFFNVNFQNPAILSTLEFIHLRSLMIRMLEYNVINRTLFIFCSFF